MDQSWSAYKHPTGWLSYDSVAGTYEKVAVPWFTPLAHDLITAVAPVPGEAVLDLGTGTGLVARLAHPAVTPGGWVVGVDPSLEMLAQARMAEFLRVVSAVTPGLPFSNGAFDVVVANLVVSHLPDLAHGLADVVRVMRPGARLGCTAWTSPVPGGPDNQRVEADEIVTSTRKRCGIEAPTPPKNAVPWEEWLYDRDHLENALANATLTDVATQRRRYRTTFAVDDFLSGWGAQARYLRHVVGERRWNEFVGNAAATLHERFGDTISCVNEVWVATARRP